MGQCVIHTGETRVRGEQKNGFKAIVSQVTTS